MVGGMVNLKLWNCSVLLMKLEPQRSYSPEEVVVKAGFFFVDLVTSDWLLLHSATVKKPTTRQVIRVQPAVTVTP